MIGRSFAQLPSGNFRFAQHALRNKRHLGWKGWNFEFIFTNHFVGVTAMRFCPQNCLRNPWLGRETHQESSAKTNFWSSGAIRKKKKNACRRNTRKSILILSASSPKKKARRKKDSPLLIDSCISSRHRQHWKKEKIKRTGIHGFFVPSWPNSQKRTVFSELHPLPKWWKIVVFLDLVSSSNMKKNNNNWGCSANCMSLTPFRKKWIKSGNEWKKSSFSPLQIHNEFLHKAGKKKTSRSLFFQLNTRIAYGQVIFSHSRWGQVLPRNYHFFGDGPPTAVVVRNLDRKKKKNRKEDKRKIIEEQIKIPEEDSQIPGLCSRKTLNWNQNALPENSFANGKQMTGWLSNNNVILWENITKNWWIFSFWKNVRNMWEKRQETRALWSFITKTIV
jgi:hypothetical protein